MKSSGLVSAAASVALHPRRPLTPNRVSFLLETQKRDAVVTVINSLLSLVRRLNRGFERTCPPPFTILTAQYWIIQ